MAAELAATYAALILADDGSEITSDKIITLTNAANLDIATIWANLLAKALEGRNVKELLSNVGSGGGGGGEGPTTGPEPTASTGAAAAAEPPKEEKVEEESDDDMGFGLFD